MCSSTVGWARSCRPPGWGGTSSTSAATPSCPRAAPSPAAAARLTRMSSAACKSCPSYQSIRDEFRCFFFKTILFLLFFNDQLVRWIHSNSNSFKLDLSKLDITLYGETFLIQTLSYWSSVSWTLLLHLWHHTLRPMLNSPQIPQDFFFFFWVLEWKILYYYIIFLVYNLF